MRQTSKVLIAVLAACSVVAAETPTADAPGDTAHKKHKKAQGPTVEQQIQALHDQMQAQIDGLKQQLADRDAALQQAQAAAAAAQSAASQAASQAAAAAQSASSSGEAVNSLQGAVADLRTSSLTVENQQKELKKAFEEPASLHYKGVRITPGGFLAGEVVFRQHGEGADINTQFSGLPYSGLGGARQTELNLSGRQSRLSLLVDGKTDWANFFGYVEGDFLSAGVTSNGNQSNSYTFRQRQAWAQMNLNNGFALTGGQMWSLVTANRTGIANRAEYLPMTIDPQYNVGFAWVRQSGFRVTKKFETLTLGFSLENAQELNIAGHGAPLIINYQAAGNTGGLYNNQVNYSFNVAPDVIGKLAFDPGFAHIEVFGIARFFRDRVFPNAVACPATNITTPPTLPTGCTDPQVNLVGGSAAGAFNVINSGGGFGGTILVPTLNKKLDVGLSLLAGAGVGRYSTSQMADVIEKPDGSLEPLRQGGGLARLEFHATPKLDIYAYYGGEYTQRTEYTNAATGKLFGYGVPTQNTTGCENETVPQSPSVPGGGTVPGGAGECTADNRAFEEGTLGYWFKLYKGKAGEVRQGVQYSYAYRGTWAGTGGSPKAIDNMGWTSFRYYLP